MEVKLETLTPVHIGTGQKYNRFECIVKGNKIFRVSFTDLIKTYPDKTETIINAAESGKLDILNALQLDETKITKYSLLNIHDYWQGEIKECVKTNNYLPYIPGSSLKGAVRTSLLWRYFRNNPSVFDKLMSQLKFEMVRGKYNKKTLMNNFIQNVFNFTKEKYTAQRDILKFVIISDFMPLKNVELLLTKINTYDLKQNDTNIIASVFAECIRGKFVGNISLSESIKFFTDNEFKRKFLEIFNVELDKKIKIEELEKKVMESIKTSLNDFLNWAMNYELELAKKMKLDIENLSGDDKIRIGFGTGTIYQTLIKLIEEADVNLAKNVVNKCNLGKFRRNIDYTTKNTLYPPYPKTLELTEDHKPLGWCEMKA